MKYQPKVDPDCWDHFLLLYIEIYRIYGLRLYRFHKAQVGERKCNLDAMQTFAYAIMGGTANLRDHFPAKLRLRNTWITGIWEASCYFRAISSYSDNM